jgi:glutaredoxin 2
MRRWERKYENSNGEFLSTLNPAKTTMARSVTKSIKKINKMLNKGPEHCLKRIGKF